MTVDPVTKLKEMLALYFMGQLHSAVKVVHVQVERNEDGWLQLKRVSLFGPGYIHQPNPPPPGVNQVVIDLVNLTVSRMDCLANYIPAENTQDGVPILIVGYLERK